MMIISDNFPIQQKAVGVLLCQFDSDLLEMNLKHALSHRQ